jgi:hypothetical protein
MHGTVNLKVVFEFKWKVTFNSKYLNCVIFYLQQTAHIPSFAAVEILLFENSQFTTNAQIVLHLNQYMHEPRLIMDRCAPLKVPGRLRKVWHA